MSKRQDRAVRKVAEKKAATQRGVRLAEVRAAGKKSVEAADRARARARAAGS